VVGVGVKVDVTAGVDVLEAVGGTVAVGVRVAVGVEVGGRVGVAVGEGVKVGACVDVAVGAVEGVAAGNDGSFLLHPLSKSSRISRRHPVFIGGWFGAKRDRFILFIPVAKHYTLSMCKALTYPRYNLVNRWIRVIGRRKYYKFQL